MSQTLEYGQLTASASANTWQYHFVRPHTTAGQFNLANGGSGPAALGVLQDDPKSGEAGNIRAFGPTKLYVDATGTAIGYGDLLVSGSTGQGKIAAGSVYSAIALQAVSSGASVLIDAIVFPTAYLFADNTP